MSIALEQLNGSARAEFVRVVGPVFEQSPWIAAATWGQRPFRSAAHLHQALCAAVLAATEPKKLALIRAHPDLFGDAALANKLSAASAGEQASAGLRRLSPDAVARFRHLNQEYRRKFSFPFIICARLNNPETILAAFEQRLNNTSAEEVSTALSEIFKIAQLRLSDLLGT